MLGIQIEICGFGTDAGLLPPEDYLDLACHWQPGFFAMHEEKFKSRLRRAQLILGNVGDTIYSFFKKHLSAQIEAIWHDPDFCSLTKAGMRLFSAGGERLLPRMLCYFNGGEIELYSHYVGERPAINEFNNNHPHRKIAVPYHLPSTRVVGRWQFNIRIRRVFEHARYNSFVSTRNRQLPFGTR